MNFSLAIVIKWIHDEIVAIRKELGLATATATPAPPEVVQHINTAQPTPQAPVDHPDPRPSFDWTPYKGSTDREAFYAFATRMGRPPNDAEQAAAYAVGVVKTTVPTPQPAPDLQPGIVYYYHHIAQGTSIAPAPSSVETEELTGSTKVMATYRAGSPSQLAMWEDGQPEPAELSQAGEEVDCSLSGTSGKRKVWIKSNVPGVVDLQLQRV